jgi:hypothetical protein
LGLVESISNECESWSLSQNFSFILRDWNSDWETTKCKIIKNDDDSEIQSVQRFEYFSIPSAGCNLMNDKLIKLSNLDQSFIAQYSRIIKSKLLDFEKLNFKKHPRTNQMIKADEIFGILEACIQRVNVLKENKHIENSKGNLTIENHMIKLKIYYKPEFENIKKEQTIENQPTKDFSHTEHKRSLNNSKAFSKDAGKVLI